MNRNDYRRTRDRRAEKSGAGRRVFWLVVGMAVAAVVVARMSDRPDVAAPRPVRPLASLKPSQMEAQVAEQGVLGGAKVVHVVQVAAKQAAESTRVSWTNSGELVTGELRVEKTHRGYRVSGVTSEKPYVWPRDADEAKADALRVAAERMAEELNGLTPELEVIGDVRQERPSPEVQKLWQESGLEADRVWVVMDVQASEESVRAERTKQRFGQIGFWVGAAFLVLLVGYGFLRLDLWTKGYLTTALGVIALLLVGGAIVMMTVVAS